MKKIAPSINFGCSSCKKIKMDINENGFNLTAPKYRTSSIIIHKSAKSKKVTSLF